MIPLVHTKVLDLPPVNRREILRYAGARSEIPELASLLDAVLAEAEPLLIGKVCWLEYPLSQQGDLLDLGFVQSDSISLKRNLVGCDRIIVFGATVGLALDRLIARYSRISPSRALMLQAVGAERIESLCDTFCCMILREAEEAGLKAVPRFSPGYGDLPLQIQADIFRILDCPRKIGLTLNESLLMSPSKSVTAIIGLGPHPCSANAVGCKSCSKTDCVYRRMP